VPEGVIRFPNIDESQSNEKLLRVLQELANSSSETATMLKKITEEVTEEVTTTKMNATWEGRLSWIYLNRWIVYVIGLAGIVPLHFLLPLLIGSPPLGISISILPMLIGTVSLFANLLSVVIRRSQDKLISPLDKARYDAERERISAIQDYGSYVVTAATVAAGVTALATRSQPLVLLYLGASVVTGIVALVPLWVSFFDWRPLMYVRHIKTVLLIWAAVFLSTALSLLV